MTDTPLDLKELKQLCADVKSREVRYVDSAYAAIEAVSSLIAEVERLRAIEAASVTKPYTCPVCNCVSAIGRASCSRPDCPAWGKAELDRHTVISL